MSANPRRFYRSRQGIIAGVCAGVAERFGWDIALTRIVCAILVLTGIFSSLILVYLVVWAVTPRRPFAPLSMSRDEEAFWNSVSDRPGETFSTIRYKYRDLDERLANMERTVTSEEWRLKRQFKDLEGS
jgi:phage shock protein C